MEYTETATTIDALMARRNRISPKRVRMK